MNRIIVSIDGRPVSLRVAATPQEQAQGYIGAKSVPMYEGIMFEDIPAGTSFHMRGVPFRLAIAFLDGQKRLIEARTMEPEDLWIPTPPGTRHAIEVHPDHLDAIRSGKLSLERNDRSALLSNRQAQAGPWSKSDTRDCVFFRPKVGYMDQRGYFSPQASNARIFTPQERDAYIADHEKRYGKPTGYAKNDRWVPVNGGFNPKAVIPRKPFESQSQSRLRNRALV